MFQRINGKKSGFVGINRVYIGRSNKTYNLSASPLANPFVIGKDGSREQVVKAYRQWLWEQVKEGRSGKLNSAWQELKRLQNQQEITLTCWCSESEQCHGDVIISCLKWMRDNNL